MKKLPYILLCICALASCGGSIDSIPDDVPTGSPPIITRVEPNTGKAGDPITIFGMGFSEEAPINLVVIGGSAVAADIYNLVDNPVGDEIEAISATVPTNASIGQTVVVVVVYDNTSNADVIFEVTP